MFAILYRAIQQYAFIVCIFFIVCSGNGFSLFAEELSSNTSQGLEFWLAVPGNDDPQQPTNSLEFYVTSLYDTEVTIEAPGFGFSRKATLKAGTVVTFSTRNETANWQWEIWKSEEKMRHGIHITATKPISVYMLNAKTVTSDGYMAIPCSNWGTKYIHNSYYDFSEVRPWKSGFCIVAKEKQTKITISLKGVGNNLAGTVKGKKIGASWSIMLDEGDVYPVMGDGTTAGGFDMTGSIVESDKPVGVISFHQRTILPFNAQNGRDHLIEMMPPVSSWGKEFHTVEFERKNKGDFFRVVASEDSTNVEMVYRDKKTGAVLGQRAIKLIKAGDFWEDFNYWIGSGQTEGIRGTSSWNSDKPVMICQYSYSANWDDANFDPFMIVLTPLEQFGKRTVFQTPSNTAFNKNFLGIIAEDDGTLGKLKSITFDGDTLYKKYPQILENRIQGTNYYWGQIQFVKAGAHSVKGDANFGAYVYGFSEFDSYGWPAAMMQKVTDVEDTIPPTITFENGGSIIDTTGELRVVFKDRVGISSGISGFDLLSNSTNYKLIPTTTNELDRYPVTKEITATLHVIDKKKPAYAVIAVNDHTNNHSYDTVHYTPITAITKLSLISPSNKAKDIDLSPEFVWQNEAQDSTSLQMKSGSEEWQTLGLVQGTKFKDASLKLKEETEYLWRLIRNKTVVSDTFTFTTIAAATIPAVLLYPEDKSFDIDTLPVFRWTRMKGIYEYILEVTTSKEWKTIEFSTAVTDSMYRIRPTEALLPKTLYYWRVTDLTRDIVIDTASFTTISKPISSIHDVSGYDGISMSVTPNPTSDMMILKFTMRNEDDLNIKIVNTLGETVYSAITDLNEYIVPCSDFTQGQYWIIAQMGNTVIRKPFIVVR